MLRRTELAVASAAAACAVVLVYAMLISERTVITHALQLAAPQAVRPGEAFPVRAFLMFGVGAGDLPELVEGDVVVRVLRGEQVLASVPLELSSTRTYEGLVTAPDVEGAVTIDARAVLAARVVATVARPLEVRPDAAGAEAMDRLAPLLSQFALGPVVVETSQLPPAAFDARISGGVCVPDQPCRIIVDLGEAGHEVRMEPGPALTVLGSTEAEGRYARLSVQVTGPEGEGTLVVSSAGTTVARRSIRLPVALATPMLDLPSPFVHEGRLTLDVAPPPGRSALIVDLVRDDRFVRSVTLPEGPLDPSGRRTVDLSFDGLPDGIYRVSLRADPFPTDHVTDRFARLGQDVEPPLDVEGPLAFSFRAAAFEASSIALPPLVSGLEADRDRTASGQGVVRGAAVAAMLVAAVLLVLAVMRRGLDADASAARLLREAGATEGADAGRHQRLTLALSVLALGLALLAGVALVTARSLFGG